LLGQTSVPRVIGSVAFSPDGTTVVSVTTEAHVTTLDAATMKVTGEFEIAPDVSIKDAFASARLGGVVLTSEGGEVVVFDAAKRKLVGESFRAGGSQLQVSAVSPDGRYLAAMSSDGGVRVWDVATRVAIGPPLQGHPPGRYRPAVWFTAEFAFSTYSPGLKIDWDLDLQRAAASACARVGRQLTELEWRQFVGDVPYQPACRTTPLAR
jgi:WD40 repeat protein